MNKKTIFVIILGVVLVVFVVVGFIVMPPIISEYQTVRDEMKKNKSEKEANMEDDKYDFLKNDEPKDQSRYRVEADGTFVNTSDRIYGMHEASYFQVNEMKIHTLKDNPKMAEVEAKITNNSDLVISNTGVYLTFIFSDGSTSLPFPLPAKYIPVGGTITSKVKILNRVIDADDYSFVIQSFNGGGAG